MTQGPGAPPGPPVPGTAPDDEIVALPGGTRLALRRRHAPGAPRATAVLVHGLASNARLWDGVAPLLAAAGIDTVAVDLRGHGASADLPVPADGHDTTTAADDVAAVVAMLGTSGLLARPVVAAGQSWGGNVVLTLAAARPATVDGIALLDGGWLRLPQYATFDEAWAALAPPVLDGIRLAELGNRLRTAHPDWPETGIAGTLANLRDTPVGARNRLDRAHHRSILRSLYDADPRELYPLVTVPALLMPAGGRGAGAAALVDEAASGLARARLAPYPDADHDLHAQFPERVAADLEGLVAEAARHRAGTTKRSGGEDGP